MTVPADAQARYQAALGVPDRRAALDVVTELLAEGIARQALLLDLVCASQREVGRRWQQGEWSVPQEHAATAINEVAVGLIMAQDPTPTGRGHLVVACVDDELHALPARVVAEIAQLDGWRVTYLGADTPAARLSAFLHELGPDAVALSCTVAMSLPRVRELIEASRQVGVPVLVGGAAFGRTDDRARRLGADGWASDAVAALEALAALPATTTPAPPVHHPGLGDHVEVVDQRADILRAAFDELVRRFPPIQGYDDEQRAHTKADLAHILDFVAAARYVADDTVLFDLTDWLLDLLQARGVAAQVLELGLDALATAAVGITGANRVLREAADRIRSTAGAVAVSDDQTGR